MSRLFASILPLAVLGALAACGEAARDVSVRTAEHAPTEWESGFAPSELTTWREGVVHVLTDDAPYARPETQPPLAGARVELLAPHPDGRRPLQKVAEATCDENGRFRVGPGPAGRWVLRATHDGSPPALVGRAPALFGMLPVAEGEIHVLVCPGRDLRVRMVDGGGAPVAGGSVRASSIGYEDVATTGEDGFATLRVPDLEIRLDAVDPRRHGATRNVSLEELVAGEPVELRAPDRGPIEGRVVDAVTGAPVAGAVVLHAWQTGLFTTTDGDGRFSLDAPREGRIAAFGRGRAWRSYRAPPAGDLDLRLGPAHPVRGRVLGPDGEPVAGARLLAAVRGSLGQTDRVLGPVTGPDGGFDFDWLPVPPRGASGQVHVLAYRRGLGWSDVATRGADDAPVTLRLRGERQLRGVVCRADGSPIEGVGIQVLGEPEDTDPQVLQLLGVRYDAMCVTGPDGSFRTSGLPAHAPVEVSMTIDTVRIERRVEPCAPGAPVADAVCDIVLAPGKEITGRVVDVDGQPVTLGGSVRAELVGHPEFSELARAATIGPDGRFCVEDLPDGMYSLRASVPTFDVGGTVVAAGTDDVELVAERPSSLEFELEFPEGGEAERVAVLLRDADDPAVPVRHVVIEPARTGSRGQIRLVRRGRYHVSAIGGPWRCTLRDVEVPDGRRPPMKLVLARTLVRSVVVEDVDGSPLSGRRVVLARLGARQVAPEIYMTGEGGATEIAGLAEGDWVARVTEEGRPPLSQRFTVRTDDLSEIVLRYPAFGTLEVNVDREALADPDAAIVSLQDAAGAVIVAWGPDAKELASRWRLPAEGPLELRGVPAGTVRVRVSSGSGTDAERDVEVAGPRTTLRLP